MINTSILQGDSKSIHYNTKDIPLYIRREKLSYRLNSQTMPHWHEDIELLQIIHGNMCCMIDNERVFLHEGDCLIITALQMHYCFNDTKDDCTYNRILFHPELLTRNKKIVDEVIDPVLSSDQIKYFYLMAGDTHTKQINSLIERMVDIHEEDKVSQELEIIGYLHIIFARLFNADDRIRMVAKTRLDPDLHAQRAMISFIHEHYAEKITLEEIALSGNVCRSKCCSLFKQFIQKTPIHFLNLYRLEVSRNLLRNTTDTVSAISQSCGFANQSYFNKMFLEEYGSTPVEFRQRERNRSKVS